MTVQSKAQGPKSKISRRSTVHVILKGSERTIPIVPLAFGSTKHARSESCAPRAAVIQIGAWGR